MTLVVDLLVLLLTPAVPFALAVALLFKRDSGALHTAAALAALPALATGWLMPPGIAATLPWLLEGSEFGLDATGRTFLFFSAALWVAAGVYARQSVDAAQRNRFFIFFLLVMSGNLGLIVARDMLAFYLFFVLMSFAAYGLVAHDRSTASRRAGRVYMILVVAGDMMLYAALVLVALDTGGDLLLGTVRDAVATSSSSHVIIALLVVGFGVKIGLLGLHVSLPLIYTAAATPAAAVLAGPVISGGLLGWLRFLPIGRPEAAAWGPALVAAGVAAAFYGVLAGLTQRRAATVLAYSSVSQMGIMTAGVGAALQSPEHSGEIVAAVVVYAMHHAFAKGALFLGAGVAGSGAATGRRRTLICAGLLVPALALTGAPMTSGMVAKEFLNESLVDVAQPSGAVFLALLPWMAFATTLIVARFLWVAWPSRHAVVAAPAGLIAAWVAVVGLAATAVWIMLVGNLPVLWSMPVLWEVSWPVVLGAAVAAIAGRAIVTGTVTPPPAVPPGDVIVAAEWVGRRIVAAWISIATRPLPAARDWLLEGVRNTRRAPLWPRVADAAEELLGEWTTATTLFVALLVVLAGVMILL